MGRLYVTTTKHASCTGEFVLPQMPRNTPEIGEASPNSDCNCLKAEKDVWWLLLDACVHVSWCLFVHACSTHQSRYHRPLPPSIFPKSAPLCVYHSAVCASSQFRLEDVPVLDKTCSVCCTFLPFLGSSGSISICVFEVAIIFPLCLSSCKKIDEAERGGGGGGTVTWWMNVGHPCGHFTN